MAQGHMPERRIEQWQDVELGKTRLSIAQSRCHVARGYIRTLLEFTPGVLLDNIARSMSNCSVDSVESNLALRRALPLNYRAGICPGLTEKIEMPHTFT